ncbi:hypothetical protein KC799_27430 [candidate division KSB1 bacterium]|nr:hypothetical protein [candidate division KSB1 bacterium]
MTNKTNSMMKIPLIVAAAVIIIRIILEHVGSPEAVNAVFGVAWLYFIIPVLFALQISKSGDSSPYKSLFISLLLFAVYTRLMVFVTYMLAWWQQWQAPRFSLAQGGVVGEDVSAMQGLFIIPLRNAVFWIIFATLIGMLVGWITILIHKKKSGVKA